MVVVDRVVKICFVIVLKINKVSIACMWLFRVVHPKNMYNHNVDYQYMSISFGMEGGKFVYLGIHHGPNIGPKGI